MFELLKKILDLNNDRCFIFHMDENGECHGVVGGDYATQYLSYACIGCPHRTE